jgi:hypothetical protein
MTARLLHEDGSPANLSTGGMLHHVVVGNSSAQDLTCAGVFPVGLLGERFFAAGNERTLATFPEGFGYYNGPAGYWAYVIEIMNMGHAAENFYLELEATFLPGDALVTPLRPLWLDMNLCGNSQYSVPQGFSDMHADWTSTTEGNIVVMGGHVHDYGISVSAENTRTGEIFCTSVAGYAEGSDAAPLPVPAGGHGHPNEPNVLPDSDPAYEGHIEDMTGCWLPHHFEVGDTIRLHTQYSSPEARNDVMGIMVAYLYETPDPPQLKGDIDCDGAVTTGDGFDVLLVAAGEETVDPCTDMDFDCDGDTDAADVLDVLAHVARTTRDEPGACFPVGSALASVNS